MPTFNQLETGRYSSPVDLYRFDYGAETFFYTSAAEEITFSGAIYEPIELKRGSPSLNPKERRNTTLQLEAAADQRPFSDFIGIQPGLRLECLIQRIQLDESVGSGSPEPTPAPTTSFIIFDGYVTSIAFSGRTCSIDMNPFNEQFSREIPRYKYHGLCNHVLYDSFCTLDKNVYSQSGLVNGEDGNDISVSGFTGTAFTGGYVVSESGADFRMIIEQSGDTLTLLLPFRGGALGSTIEAFQGCDHSVETCKTKFSNVTNFGGYPLVPGINPFSQSTFTKN